MKTPKEIAHGLRGPWDIVTDGMLTRVAAAIAAEREQTTIARTGLDAAVDERNRLRADLADVCETLDMVLAASPTPPVGPVLDRITKYRAWRGGALMTDERNRLRADLAEAQDVLTELWCGYSSTDDVRLLDIAVRARALLDRLKGEQK